MTLTEAINLAKQGRSVGWSIIIHSTYNEKKFITSKYQETALDKTLHDSYVKALSNIHLLNDPEIFSSWLGIIIASISTIELSNKNHISFSEIEPCENETLYLDVLNTMDSAPEQVDLSENDIKKISKKLFSSIKTEQKMCMLYHYVEGFSVTEISRALHCTEAAVISFLNAGIKKAETVFNHLAESYPVLSEFSNPVQLMMFILDAEYGYFQKEEISEKAFNAIIEDTARVVAENYYKADSKPVAKKAEQSSNTVKESNDTADDDEDDDDDDERKAGLFGNKKMIFIIAVILAIVAGLTIYFVSGNEKNPNKPSDSTSESSTVSTEKPTLTTEESTSEPSTEESTTDEAQPVVNPNQGSQSNNQQSPNNNTPQYRPPQNNNSNNSNQNNSSSNNTNSNNTTQNNQQTGTTSPANTVAPKPPAEPNTTSAPKPPAEPDTTSAPKPPEPQIPDIVEEDDPMPDIE